MITHYVFNHVIYFLSQAMWWPRDGVLASESGGSEFNPR